MFEKKGSNHKALVLLARFEQGNYFVLFEPDKSRANCMRTMVALDHDNVQPIDLHYRGRSIGESVEFGYLELTKTQKRVLHIVQVSQWFLLPVLSFRETEHSKVVNFLEKELCRLS